MTESDTSTSTEMRPGPAKPPWIKVRLGQGGSSGRVQRIVSEHGLHTVCEEALCPNKGRCWENGRATVMILGDRCSRNCRFCAVQGGADGRWDAGEPERVAAGVMRMGLSDVVITSVTRDDLPDGGAAVWSETIRRVRETVPGICIEVLVPDFGGAREALDQVLDACPDVFGHNLEVVPQLYSGVRTGADYRRSLEILRHAHERGSIVKTGVMLGLGETEEQVMGLMEDALECGCDILTLGQYLQPTKASLPVQRYVTPGEFDAYRERGLRLGFAVVVAAPLVRSSYYSEDQDAFVRKRRSLTS